MASSTAHSGEREVSWKITVKATGLACEICGTPPDFEEREEFLETGICRACSDALTSVITVAN
jgi:hypothetical protein